MKLYLVKLDLFIYFKFWILLFIGFRVKGGVEGKKVVETIV